MDPAATTSVATLVLGLRLSALVMVVVAVALGLLVSPALFGLALIAVLDLALAWMLARGTIGPLAGRRAAEDSGDAATIAESDPSYNPYARED